MEERLRERPVNKPITDPKFFPDDQTEPLLSWQGARQRDESPNEWTTEAIANVRNLP